MALALITEPDELQPVVNPVVIVYDSSFSDQSGFRYKVELINSGGTDEITTWIYPDTNNDNYCVYNFNMLLNDLITSDVNYDITGYTICNNSLYKYNYRVTEYIGTTSGSTTTGATDKYVFRGVQQYEDVWSSDDYITRTGSTAKFLSNKIKRNYTLDENAVINTLNGSFDGVETDWTRLVIDVHKGVTSAKFYYEQAPHSKKITSLPIGPSQLNIMATNGDIKGYITGAATSSNILESDDDYYNIWLENSTGQTASETLRIDLEHGCYKHDGVVFVYLGDLSTYEQYTFRMADIKSFNTNRNEIKKDYYSLINNKWTYNIGDRGRKNININTSEKHEVLSGWIKDDEAADLMELFRSPDVYWYRDGEIYPIIIKTTGYEEKKIKNDVLFNYTINFELAYQKYSNI